ncbi:MAG TPA: hypothetical protein VFR58_03310 [Flavisolibacter sp.]|nr:hypothetical protein [Flavisolibacter sp.]
MSELKNYLEEQMDLKRMCSIRFRAVDGAVTTIRAHIIKMDNVSGRDMIETDAGLVIGVDQLVQVNDRPGENYC